MAEPFLSEIRLFGFAKIPSGWTPCDGQLLPINTNVALFSLLGTRYGGDGQVNFALPDLRGRSPLGQGGGHLVGARGGAQSHTLNVSELPRHTHGVNVAVQANAIEPGGNLLASPAKAAFAAPGTGTPAPLAAESVSGIGDNFSHENLSPFLTLNYCMATRGIFPSRG